MSCKVLAICDSEHSYAELLTKQLLRIPGNRLEIRNFTNIEKLKEYAKDKVMTYLLVSEKYREEVRDIEALSYYFLTEDKKKEGNVLGEKLPMTYLYRYMSAQEIYATIVGENMELDMLSEVNDSGSVARNITVLGDKKVEFIGVYQPVHRNGSTTVAKAISHIKGTSSKVLYVNLEEYPGHMTKELERDAIDLGVGNLGDVLYYLKQSQELAINHLESIVHKLKTYHVLAPIGVSQELRQITWSEWKSFLEVLRSSEYNVVVMDIHSCVQGFTELLEMCDKVYCPEIMGRSSTDKDKSFQQEMRLLGKTQMLLKMESLVIPEYASNIEAKVEEKLRTLLGD